MTTKLEVSKVGIANRMLFNNILGPSKVFLFDVMNAEMTIVRDIHHCNKCSKYKFEYLSIIPERWYEMNDNILKPIRNIQDNIIKLSFSGNGNAWSNKNIAFEFSAKTDGSERSLKIVESNKQRKSIVTTDIYIKDNYKYIVIFYSEALLKCPVIAVKGNGFENAKMLLDNLEDWLIYGEKRIVEDTDDFEDNIGTVTFGNNTQIDSVPMYKNIETVLNTANDECIIVNEYGEVVHYTNKATDISMEVIEDENLGTVTKILLGKEIIYRYIGGYERISLNEEFLQSMVEQGIYRRDPETDEYYVKDKSDKRILTIKLDKQGIHVSADKFKAELNNTSLQFFAENGINVYEDNSMYIDTFTHVEDGVMYYNDYSSDGLYCRDIFGVPYLNTSI